VDTKYEPGHRTQNRVKCMLTQSVSCTTSLTILQKYGTFEVVKIRPTPKEQTPAIRQSRNLTDDTSLLLARRVDQDPGYWRPTDSWAPSQFTLPRGKACKDPSSVEYELRRIPPYRISSRSELGSGQYIYVIGEQGINKNHHVSAPIPAWNEYSSC
jgi:hypothetical protein